MLTASLALLIVLIFLFFAVQLLVNLYVSSTVTSTAFEGARIVASSTVDPSDAVSVSAARTRAESKMRSLLGPQGQRATFDWSASDLEQVVLRVQLDTPRFAMPRWGSSIPMNRIDRTVRVRVETLR
ncbi:MAG: hypothetical protein HYX32_05715 [Actinobacteria bacterium]|nr:hypothetical protein [Actinomycetota bacterium]